MERAYAHHGRSGIPLPKSRLPLPSSSFRKSRSSLLSSPSRERLRADGGLDLSRLRRTTQDPLSNAHHDQNEREPPVNEMDVSLTWSGDMPSPKSTPEVEEHSQISAPETENSELVVETNPLTENTLDPFTKLHASSSSRPGSSLSHRSQASSRRDDGLMVEGHTHPDSPPLSHRSSSKFPPNGKSSTISPTSRKKSLEHGQSRRNLRAPKGAVQDPSPAASESPNMSTGQAHGNLRRKSSTASHLSVASNRSRKASPSPSPNNPRDPVRISVAATKTSPDSENVPVPAASQEAKTSSSSSPAKKAVTPAKKRVAKPGKIDSSSHDSSSAASPNKTAPSKSSSALRETIAKAKAAARENAKKEKIADTPPPDPLAAGLDIDDPFNQGPKGQSAEKLALQKRIDAGRGTGTLNITGLGLKKIPQEVLKMYELDPEGGFSLSDSVDLVRLIAADNEFEGLADEAFPDVNMRDVLNDANFLSGFVFGGLEVLDLHYNSLKSLPVGLRRLGQLRSINVSDNKLNMDVFGVLSQLHNLADLKIARNGLQGCLDSGVYQIQRLETLDLSGNALTQLPADISSLSSLRVLDVSSNKISSLPFDALSQTPLQKLHANRSGLSGVLIPSSVTELRSLRILDVTENALQQLTSDHQLALPNLEELLIDMNRIDHVPGMSTFQSLTKFSARECKIAEVPKGLSSLPNLASIDLSFNDIKRLDERIGLMKGLTRFSIANNPLTDRKYLTMETEQLKTDLRARCEVHRRARDSHTSRRHASGDGGVDGSGDGHDVSETESEDTFFSMTSDTTPSIAVRNSSA